MFENFCKIILIAIIFCFGCVSNNEAENLELIPEARVDGCYKNQYPPASTSEYILPYTPGKTFTISQGNCGKFGTHRPICKAKDASGDTILCGDRRYAYDFALPIGEKILASRAGIVSALEESFSNSSNSSSETNYVVITHEDNTVAVYLHLSPEGVLVELGEMVAQGQEIAIAGNSGFTGSFPHLHFDVLSPPFNMCSNEEHSGCKTIPISFRNAEPQDFPLIEGKKYLAKPF